MPSSAPPVALRALIAPILVAGLLAAAPAQAVDATLRLQGQVVTSSANAVGFTNDFGSGPGAYLGVEFRLNDRFGIEVGAAWLELEESEEQASIFASVDVTASLTVTPVTVALDVHLTPQKRYDLYLAPKIGWAFVDDLEFAARFNVGPISIPGFPQLPVIPGLDDVFVTPFRTEDQFVFGLRLGVDVPFGDGSWSFSSSLDYTDMDLEIEAFRIPVPAASLDPLSFGAGVAYRF